MTATALTTNKPRWPCADAIAVARELCDALRPVTSRLIVAGSLRRKKATVGDVEILYIPKTEVRPVPGDMFASGPVNLADESIAQLIERGVLDYRINSAGSRMFGEKNKLVRHVASGIPVDLFAATEKNWFNYLVCRTGPAESNVRIASLAADQGWQWNPYGTGFSRAGDVRAMGSEEEVFEFVGLACLPPELR